MNRVFIYWDNSNIFVEAQRLAEEKECDIDARYRMRIHFDHMLRLAHADRPLEKAIAAGSIPPELQNVWNRLENQNVEVELFDRGSSHSGEQDMPDKLLQLQMIRDALDNNGDPGVAVVLTGDGAGYLTGAGFHSDLERMHKKGWRIEVLSWLHSCNKRMRQWAEKKGIFVPLDDYYESITFLEPSKPGYPLALPRHASPLDLSSRPCS